MLEWEHRYEIDNKPTFEDVVLSNSFQVSHNLKCFWMFETLDEVEEQVNPEHCFNECFEKVQVFIVRGCECNVKHGSDTGITDHKKDEYVENSLPFTS
jgi:hypothetical protein